MRKNWTKVAIALGPLVIIASLVWEYARVNQAYNFIVEPWALRGYETNHFPVFLTAALIALVAGAATSWEGTLKPAVSAGITVFLIAAATIFTFVFVDDPLTISRNTGFAVAISLLLSLSLAISLKSLLGGTSAVFKRASLSFLVLFIVFFLVLGQVLGEGETEVAAGFVVLFAWVVVGGMALAIKPITMAANRVLIFASVNLWALILFSGGALRQNLIDEQLATMQANGVSGVAVAYKDTQTAPGWWLAGTASFLLFVGAVGLWAKRRDIVAAIARARKQRAAAEISAREIREAAEAYAKELEARGASNPGG